jgi:hypothetical protein
LLCQDFVQAGQPVRTLSRLAGWQKKV